MIEMRSCRVSIIDHNMINDSKNICMSYIFAVHIHNSHILVCGAIVTVVT